jgi:predicted transcriptional regulator
LKHRTKEEIAALILEAIINSNRATSTIIMYKAYLGYVQLKAFLSSLLEKGLIEYNKQDRLYTITEKGMHFLQVYSQLNQLRTTTSALNPITSQFQIIEHLQIANDIASRQSNHLAMYNEQGARTNHTRKCEKCLTLCANHKELKLHKVQYHSY